MPNTSQDYKNTLAKQLDLNWDGAVFTEEKHPETRQDSRKQKKRNHKPSLCQAQN